MITVGELTAWILLHRKGNAFKDYSLAKIVCQLDEAITNNCIFCSHNGKAITGVAMWETNDEKKVVHVHDIITTEPQVIGDMVKAFNKMHPDYLLSANRNGKLVTFKQETLLQRL